MKTTSNTQVAILRETAAELRAKREEFKMLKAAHKAQLATDRAIRMERRQEQAMIREAKRVVTLTKLEQKLADLKAKVMAKSAPAGHKKAKADKKPSAVISVPVSAAQNGVVHIRKTKPIIAANVKPADTINE